MSLEVGIKGTCTVTADESNSAKTMRSGTLDVFATPAMIALMEKRRGQVWLPIWNRAKEPWESIWTFHMMPQHHFS